MTDLRPVGSDVVAMLAVSLDGYIADAEGGVGFLEKYDDLDFDFEAFTASVGGLVTGRHTFEQAVGFGWHLGHIPTLVLTSQSTVAMPEGADVRLSNADTAEAIEQFAFETPGRLWVFGGAEVVMAGIEGGVIDRLDLMVMPEALGSGIALFPRATPEPFTLETAEPYGAGAIRLVYRLR